ncbi:hypothetical protein ACFQZ4_28950 [Catellatospora coxensis]
MVEELGAWRLRAAGGYTGRANSALPVGDPGLPLPEAIDAVVAFYRRQGLPRRSTCRCRWPRASSGNCSRPAGTPSARSRCRSARSTS